MHAGNSYPVTLHYQLPTWNALYGNFWRTLNKFLLLLFTSRHSMNFKTAGKSFRVCILAKNKMVHSRRHILVNKLVVIRHHTTVIATPRRLETRQHIAEYFHWLTSRLNQNTQWYSLIFNHWYFFRPRQMFLQGVRTHRIQGRVA